MIPDTEPELVGQATKSSPPFISVIVPVRNEEEHVAETLKQLLVQAYDPSAYEVIVVDGESTDGTRAVVRSLQALHANLRLYRNPRKLSSAPVQQLRAACDGGHPGGSGGAERDG